MSEGNDWLPPLIRLEQYDGDWHKYVDAVFAIFYRDFIEKQPRFQNKLVRCRRDPIHDGKEAGFWHCVSEGVGEDQRTPDLRRCERIGWLRKIIEHAQDPRVTVWMRRKQRERRHYLWLDESYLVALGERKHYYQLITAFCTDRAHTKMKLKRESKESRND